MTAIPVIFIHGFADITHRWRRLAIFLQRHGVAVRFFEYPTLRNKPDVPGLAAALKQYVDSLGPDPFTIVAHSQGGLIAEWFDLFFHDHRLRTVITMGTPFHGSLLAAMPPKTWVEHSPVGRGQLRGLGTMSQVIHELIKGRVNHPTSTRYVNYIGITRRLAGLDSDLVVVAVEANRNADYFEWNGMALVRRTSGFAAETHLVRKNHWPAAYVRGLGGDDDKMGRNLLASLHMEQESHIPTEPDQCALVYPSSIKPIAESSAIILRRKTVDPRYCIMFLRSQTTPIIVTGCELLPTAGRFSYVLDPYPGSELPS